MNRIFRFNFLYFLVGAWMSMRISYVINAISVCCTMLQCPEDPGQPLLKIQKIDPAIVRDAVQRLRILHDFYG